ncbi:hypothetical protein HHK36_011404 [Tetracentron sinense]|uniref:Uncharacterized protein n=1 Tax=Tetracentron sinense TaxID=13715 RepID=A0A834ZB30_TETSI|nr:hypothetical protein HHK36_011404 [Tetracentron sinense]
MKEKLTIIEKEAEDREKQLKEDLAKAKAKDRQRRIDEFLAEKPHCCYEPVTKLQKKNDVGTVKRDIVMVDTMIFARTTYISETVFTFETILSSRT